MAAGRTLATYNTDLYFLPAQINIDVPNNLYAEAALGWTAATANAPRSPRRLTPRHAIGRNAATGRRARVTVADPAATLWTGAATTWTSIQNDGTVLTYTVTGLVGEKATV
jgi:hypothetical protein